MKNLNKYFLPAGMSFFASISILFSFGQEHKKILAYEMKNDCYKYDFRRTYLNDSVFVESYCDKASKEKVTNDTFMISKKDWYYLLDGTYEPLFTRRMFESKEIARHYPLKIHDSTYLLFKQTHIAYEPLKKGEYNNREVWIYYFYSWGERTSIANYYPDLIYFDPDFGIVKREERDCGTGEMRIIQTE